MNSLSLELKIKRALENLFFEASSGHNEKKFWVAGYPKKYSIDSEEVDEKLKSANINVNWIFIEKISSSIISVNIYLKE